ncbi:sodium-dependent glucose transporter 1A-like isoform X2 [Haemaphysalis longicornis]
MLCPRADLWLKIGRTCNCCLGCFGMGLVLALSGVALLDLAEIYRSDVPSVSQLITTRCVGGLLGSLLGGKLYDTYNTQLMSVVMMALASISVLMIPLSGILWVAHVMAFIGGISFGAFDTGANVWIIKLWPENSSPALQVFHLAFGVGCLVAPLIAEPFLSKVASVTSFNETQNLTEYLTSNETSYTTLEPLELLNQTSPEYGTTTVHYAFGMVSAFHLILVVSMLVLYFIDKADFKPGKSNDEAGSDKKVEDVRFTRIVVALLSAYVCVYVALECTCSQMLTAYAVKSDLHFSKSSASRVAAVYFFCFAGSRLAAALMTIKVSSFQILVGAHVILAVAAVMLVIWGSTSSSVLWAGSALNGIGQGPVYAAAVAWTVDYIVMSNKMMSIVIVTAGIGALSPPLLVGLFLDRYPNLFLYVCFGALLLCVAFFVGMYFYVRRRPLLSASKEVCANRTGDKARDMSSF